MSDLLVVESLVNGCQAERGLLAKENVLRQHAQLKDLIRLVYDPYQVFGITSTVVKKHMKRYTGQHSPLGSLHELLESLCEGVRSHAVLERCIDFIQTYGHQDIVLSAIDKDLRLRLGVASINKVFPMLIPQFAVALGHPADAQRTYDLRRYHISRKLDGVRTLVVCADDGVNIYSRAGHVFPETIKQLVPIREQFKDFKHMVFDGEMCTDNMDFNMVNAIMNPRAKKGVEDDVKLVYHVFDWIPLKTFQRGEGPPTWSIRQAQLEKILPVCECVQIVEQMAYSESRLETQMKMAAELGWEGLILRRDTNYRGKKCNDILKFKLVFDDDFEILEATTSMQTEPTSSRLAEALEHVRVSLNGDPVWVGGGFTWEERLYYASHLDELVGKGITVQHNGETQDRTGKRSLRHPRKKMIGRVA